MLGVREGGLGDGDAGAAQARGADRDEESGDRLLAPGEIGEALADEVAAGKAS